MQADSTRFPENVAAARRDETLLGALDRLQRDARAGRVETVARLPEFEALRDAARDIRNGALANLAANLERPGRFSPPGTRSAASSTSSARNKPRDEYARLQIGGPRPHRTVLDLKAALEAFREQARNLE